MAEPSIQEAKVDQLKAEGFVQKYFRKAHFKYSEAIKLDGNRAASALSMKEYVTIDQRW